MTIMKQKYSKKESIYLRSLNIQLVLIKIEGIEIGTNISNNEHIGLLIELSQDVLRNESLVDAINPLKMSQFEFCPYWDYCSL